MSRKKKKKFNAPPAGEPVLPASPVQPLPTSEAFTRQITFDSLEDSIRGEEMLQEQEQKKIREATDVKKQIESAEVDRRLEELRKQLGLGNGPKARKKN